MSLASRATAPIQILNPGRVLAAEKHSSSLVSISEPHATYSPKLHNGTKTGYIGVCKIWTADSAVDDPSCLERQPLTITLHRKFLGGQHVPKGKAQQSKLAFGTPKSANEKSTENNDAPDAAPKADPSPTTIKSDDADSDVEMKGDSRVDEADSKSPATNGTRKVPSVTKPPKRTNAEIKAEEDEDDEPVTKRSRRGRPAKDSEGEQSRNTKAAKKTEKIQQTPAVGRPEPKIEKPSPKNKAKSVPQPPSASKTSPSKSTETKSVKHEGNEDEDAESRAESEQDEAESEEEVKPEVAAKARERVQTTLKEIGKDPYPDWKAGEPVPYAALCTTFSLVEMTTKRLIILAHCSLFLRQVLRLTPNDLLPTVQLMINKLAADYAGIELGIGESLIMKAIGETTGRSLSIIKADQNEIGDLGLVAAKSRSNQPTMFKPKPLTVRGVLDGLMSIATVSGDGSQGRKIAGIKKLLSAADADAAGKGAKAIDITKNKGGPSEAKFVIRFLEGKLRLGLAEKTVLVAVAQAMVMHESWKQGNKVPSSEKLAQGEAILKTVYR